jgi:fatty acyl-CoA reductase
VQEFSAVPKERLLKVSSVEGDMEKEGLGLSSEDREFLLTSQISVVFHIAASVRLHEPLVTSVKSNALPVIELIGLCEEMPEIKVKKTSSKYKHINILKLP